VGEAGVVDVEADGGGGGQAVEEGVAGGVGGDGEFLREGVRQGDEGADGTLRGREDDEGWADGDVGGGGAVGELEGDLNVDGGGEVEGEGIVVWSGDGGG
jgi:hypothetical protein